MNNEPKLTIRQEKFVEAIVDPETKSQSEAAIKAGFPVDTARITASQLLTNPNIRERIEQRKAEMAKYANIHADLVFGGTALRATASIDDALDEQGRFDIEKARETGVIHQIKRITRTPNKYGESVSIELYGKDAAQDKLGQYLGLEQMPRANDQDIEDTIRKRLLEAGYDEAEARAIAAERYQISNEIQ